MFRKIISFLGFFILLWAVYKFFGSDILSMLDGIVNIVVRVGDWGSDILLQLWAKINS